MTDNRIKAAQENIQENLKIRPEYVLDTSEFHSVRARLAMLENRRKPDNKDPDRPSLRRSSGSGHPTDADSDEKSRKSDQDERPTLKRRN